jgi:hypothetical protein
VYPDWSRASVRACASISTCAAATLPRTAAQCSAVCCSPSRACTLAPFCAPRPSTKTTPVFSRRDVWPAPHGAGSPIGELVARPYFRLAREKDERSHLQQPYQCGDPIVERRPL